MKKNHVTLMALSVCVLVACDNGEQTSEAIAKFNNNGASGREGMPAVAIKNSCDACHTVTTRKVGPSLMEVSRMYKGNPEAAAHLNSKIRKGGAGVWGTMPMPPNSAMSDPERKEMVDFILGLAK